MNKEKQIKAIISGLIAKDDEKISEAINCLSEAIVAENKNVVMNAIVESLRGDHNV